MTPAKEVGGDFYAFFLLDEDHLALVMADVSRKGAHAALFMVIAKTLIKNRAQMGGGPGEILQYVNEQLCEATNAQEALFGTDRMLTALNRNPGAAPEKLLRTVRKDINAFVGDAPQFDDITMLGLYYMGSEEKSDG